MSPAYKIRKAVSRKGGALDPLSSWGGWATA
jgi:hypothetical protein